MFGDNVNTNNNTAYHWLQCEDKGQKRKVAYVR